MAQHFSVSRLKKSSSLTTKKSHINKRSVLSLMLLEYHIFLKSLLKEANMEARAKRAKVIRRDHVKAVGKRVLKKFKA